MGTVQKMIDCKSCDRSTLHIRERPNHLLHLILTLLTLGLWVIPWSWVTLAAGKPKCTVCGKPAGVFQS